MNSTSPGVDDLLTVSAAAAFLQIHPKSLYRLIAARQIPFIRKAGVGYRFVKADLMGWLREGFERADGWRSRL